MSDKQPIYLYIINGKSVSVDTCYGRRITRLLSSNHL